MDDDPWGVSSKHKSPVYEEDDFDFADGGNKGLNSNKASNVSGPKHMPTFGINVAGGSVRSQRSGSRKKDDSDDEFDNILDSIAPKEEPKPEPSPRPSARDKRKAFGKATSMIEPQSLQNSAKKDELEQRKRAMFGISGSSDGRQPKFNAGPRSQVAPDDGNRGISTRLDKNDASSSIGRNATNNSGGFDNSPIGVIETSKSRRVVKRKEPGGGSIPRPQTQNRVKTADVANRQNANTNADDNRFERNVKSPPNFNQRPDTGQPKPNKAPLINKPDEDDEEFERDDDQDILELMEAPDTRDAQSKASVTPKKVVQIKNSDDEEEDMEEDLFSGGYVPSTMSKNVDDKKGDASNEATPIARGRRPLAGANKDSGSRQKDSRDSFSPPEIGENQFISSKNPGLKYTENTKIEQPKLSKQSKSAIPTLNKEQNKPMKNETSVPLDDLSRAKMELAEVQNKTAEIEQSLKREIENIRFEQKKDVQNLEAQYAGKVESHNREIKRLVDEMNQSIKQEREKLEIINLSELNNKRKQYEIELQKQRNIYDQQNQVFENQLKQQIELNKMLEQVRNSSNNIESTLTQLNDDKSRGIDFQIDELKRRERDLEEKLKSIEYETKEADNRTEKVTKEILEYERKNMALNRNKDYTPIFRSIGSENNDDSNPDASHSEINKETIWREEAEFNLERINKEIADLQQEYEDKINAVELEKKVVLSERQHLFEMIQMERRNQEHKFSDLGEMDHQLAQEEIDYEQRLAEYEAREDEINDEYNNLKLRMEIYDEEKEKFEDEASKVHQYSLMVQQESERIANFKFNYESMRKELEKSREIIARERALIKTEKLRHMEMIGELETRQRALELMRGEYVKERSDIAQQMWAIKRPLSYKVEFKAPTMNHKFHEPLHVSYMDY